jgi:hypothetical protein
VVKGQITRVPLPSIGLHLLGGMMGKEPVVGKEGTRLNHPITIMGEGSGDIGQFQGSGKLAPNSQLEDKEGGGGMDASVKDNREGHNIPDEM